MALRNIDDLFEMFLQVYERALLVTCPILLLFCALLPHFGRTKCDVLIAALAIIWNLLGH